MKQISKENDKFFQFQKECPKEKVTKLLKSRIIKIFYKS